MSQLDSPSCSSEMNENDLAFNRMVVNHKLIRKYCIENACETNDRFAADCDRLLKSAEFVHRIASEYYFDSIHDNGFVTFIRLASIYTDKIVEQIGKSSGTNKIHSNYLKLMKLVLNYADWMLNMHEDLKDDRKDEKNEGNGLYVRTKSGFAYRRLYESTK